MAHVIKSQSFILGFIFWYLSNHLFLWSKTPTVRHIKMSIKWNSRLNLYWKRKLDTCAGWHATQNETPSPPSTQGTVQTKPSSSPEFNPICSSDKKKEKREWGWRRKLGGGAEVRRKSGWDLVTGRGVTTQWDSVSDKKKRESRKKRQTPILDCDCDTMKINSVSLLF